MLVVLILPSLMLIGCARSEQVIRPITGKDIFFVDGNICMTKEYMTEILEVKLDMEAQENE